MYYRTGFLIFLIISLTTNGFSLTSGPTQPEYGAFTPSNQEGMVDLLSGDFTYSIPLMDIPGPALHYPLTLGYRAGIQLEQEATTVGLGWSLNPGSITRNLNRYPDDYYKGRSVSRMYGDSVIEQNLTSVFFEAASYGLSVNVGERSDQGSVFSIDVKSPLFDTRVAEYNSRNGWNTPPVSSNDLLSQKMFQYASSVTQPLSFMGISLQNGGFGFNSPGSGYGASFGFNSSTLSVGAVNTKTSSTTFGIRTPIVSFGISRSTSTSWLAKTENDRLYGYLYFSDMPTDDKNYNTQYDKLEYQFAQELSRKDLQGSDDMLNVFSYKKGFAVSTADGYIAHAEGFNSMFKPYRQDIGDYFGMDRTECSVSPWISWLDQQWFASFFQPWIDNTKNSQLNVKNHECGKNVKKFASINDSRYSDGSKYPAIQFREIGSTGGAYLTENFRQDRYKGPSSRVNYLNAMEYRVNYTSIYLPRWDADEEKIVYEDYSNTSYIDDRISTANGIYPRFQNSFDPNNPNIPAKALTGFTVVRSDGIIYEYLQPVFNYCIKTASRSKGPSSERKLKYNEMDFGDINSSTSMQRAYAYSWLLTGIKTPDYIDLGSSGIDDSDLGSWVKFSYNSKVPAYHYRTPYAGLSPSGIGIDSLKVHETYYDAFGQASWGVKEIYFLTDITTPTHHAKLQLSNRDDGMECVKITSADTFPISPNLDFVYLKDIVPSAGDTLVIDVVTFNKIPTKNIVCTVTSIQNNGNSEYQILNGAVLDKKIFISGLTGISGFGLIGTKVVWKRNKSNSARLKKIDRIDLFARKTDGTDYPEPVHSVRFGYETDVKKQLCPKIPNSFNPDTNSGKLTLRTVEIGAGSNFLPSYNFSYYMEGMDAPYNPHSWDRWGYYKRDGGMINTLLKNNNVTDWSILLDSLQSANSGHLAYELIVQKLQLTSPDDIGFLTSNPSVDSLKDIHKMKIIDALNLAINDTGLYKHFKSQIDILYQNGSRYPYCRVWKNYVTSGNSPLIQSDGSVRTSPVPDAFEINHIKGFNLALISELVYVKSSRTSEITENDRIIMKFLDNNRFDHNTNPEDVKAWSLKSISLPSGGKINIDLESDDYTYVNHTRASDPATATGTGSSASDIKDISFFKKIGMEKDLISSGSMLKIKKGDFNNTEELTQGGNQAYNKIKIRGSSLFRLYRNVGTADNPHWQFNKEFEKLKEWNEQCKTDTLKRKDPRFTLHLIALLDPFSFSSWIQDVSCIKCANQDGYSTDNRESFGISLIPIDLGPINEPFKFFDIVDNGNRLVNGNNETVTEDSICQRRYVEFTIEELTEQYQNWESKQLLHDTNHKCAITYGFRNMQYECGDDEHTIFLPSADKRRTFMFQMVWGRKIDFDDTAEVSNLIPDKVFGLYSEDFFAKPCYMDRIISDNRTYTIKQAALEGTMEMCYWDSLTNPAYPVRRGILSWNFLEEFGWNLTYDEPISDKANKDDFQFEENFYDYYSINTAVKIEEPDLSAHVAGVPGGGIRVKRISYNNGWPQKKGQLSQNRVVEYEYVCDAGNGKPGNFSSGATPSVPPPFSNKGDDRNQQTPQTSLITGTPRVNYGTVHEIRPGLGRIVHNYLTCADVTDFWADDSNNYYYYDTLTYRYIPINGIYNADPFPANDFQNPLHRWRLNKCSHFSGLPVSQSKYDQNGKMVSDFKFRYQTSMSSIDLCNLVTLCKINDVNSKVNGALLPFDKSSVYAGSPKYKFGYHPLSNYMGSATERFRVKRLCDDELVYASKGGDPEMWVQRAYNEIESVEHSVHQYEVQSTVFGVGTRKINAYYDFITGLPLVVTELESKKSFSEGCSSCGQSVNSDETLESSVPAKTTVTIPAYWIDSYNDTSNGQISMGPASNSNNNIQLQTGTVQLNQNSLKQKNMLSQSYSSSVYSNLLPPECMTESCVKANKLNGKTRHRYISDNIENWSKKLRDEHPDAVNDSNSLFSRTVTTWKRFTSNISNNVWRKSKDIVLRVPMTSDKHIDHSIISPTQIDYPWADPSTLSPDHYITTTENVSYDSYGNTLESKDANGSYSCSFFDSRLKGLYNSGKVLNSKLNECGLLTCDEQDDLPLPSGWTTSGTLSKSYYRSGYQSLQLQSGQSVSLSLPSTSRSNYIVSFWIRKGGNCKLIVNGVEKSSFSISSSGSEWHKVFYRSEISGNSGLTVAITSNNNTIYVDDIRIYPADAQAFTMTHNFKGQLTSYAGADDNIAFFNYDIFGRMTEIKDQDGMIVSTQSQYNAR